MRNVSIMIPTFGQWQYTEACLTYLINNANGEPFDEIVIADTVPPESRRDCTQDKLKEIQEKGFLGVPAEKFKIHMLDKNYGCTITINRGTQFCHPENDVMFISNDIFMGWDWLRPLRAAAYDPRWSDKIGFVAPFISPEVCLDEVINTQFRQDYFNIHYKDIINEKDLNNIFAFLDRLYGGSFVEFSKKFAERHRGHFYDEMHSTTMYFKRDTLNTIGLLDEQFSYLFNGELGGYGSDDIDMYIRQTNAGLFRLTVFESFAHHLICGTNRKRTSAADFKDIQSGNKLLNKWEPDMEAEPLVWPFEIVGNKVPHRKWKTRVISLQGDPYKVNWGGAILDEMGYFYMINKMGGYDRTDAFPL